MRRRRIAALALAAALATAATAGAAGSTARPAASAAADAENGFALALLTHLGGDGNVIYSPYSIATALAMVDAGAQGSTAAQIDRLLGAPTAAAAVSDARALRAAVDAAAGGESVPPGAGAPTLEVANALWTQTGVPIEAPFVSALTDGFGAPPRATGFRSAPDSARLAIDGWVSQHTAGLIPSLLPPGSLSPATVFVLANAIYLKARWASPFNKALTHPAPFTTAAGQRVTAQFMTANNAGFAYAATPGYQAVDLPYRSSSLSLLAILPTAGTLTGLHLDAAALDSLAGSLRLRRVDLLMPKIHLRTQTALNGPLEALGMTSAFGPSADLRGITRQVPLSISLVEHAADLKVDEQGTVAAAATGIVGPTAIALPPGRPVTVDVDHPYLLLLRDDRSGAVLFVARVADPDSP
jgi:serpin B